MPAIASSAPAIADATRRRATRRTPPTLVGVTVGLVAACAGGAGAPDVGRQVIAPASAEAVEAAFLDRASDPSTTFRVRSIVRIEVAGLTADSTIVITSDLHVRGEDATGTMTVTGSDGSSTSAQLVEVDGQAWTRFDGGDWDGPTPIGSTAVGQPNPLVSLTADDVAYTGPTSQLAPGLHRLDASASEPPALAQLTGEIAGASLTAFDRDIVVRTDGTPVAARTSLTLYGEVERGGALEPVTVMVTISTRFSDWGAPVEIAAPVS
jgi:hypothetical protein